MRGFSVLREKQRDEFVRREREIFDNLLVNVAKGIEVNQQKEFRRDYIESFFRVALASHGEPRAGWWLLFWGGFTVRAKEFSQVPQEWNVLKWLFLREVVDLYLEDLGFALRAREFSESQLALLAQLEK